MSGIGIITNPHSKQNKRNPQTSELLGYILGTQGHLAITQSLADLHRVAEKFKEKDIEILAINGGDGTVARTLRAFIETYGEGAALPKIAILRGGTMNVLAQNLGIRGRPERVLYRLIEAYSATAQLSIQRIRPLKIEGNYGFLFADGAAYNMLDIFYKDKKGPVGAAVLVFKIIGSALVKGELFRQVIQSKHLKLTPKSYPPISSDTLTLMAASIERMPFGFKLFPLAKKRSGTFQFFAVTSKPEQILWHLPSLLLRNQEGSTTGKISFVCESLAIQADSGYTYTLDGELFNTSATEVRIDTGPELEFIVV